MFKFLKSTKALFIFVLLCALVFRVTNIDFIEFKGDEAINLFLATRPLFGHMFAPGGTVSSVGILNPPIFNYILFPLTLISIDPKILSLVIGIINSFSIAFLFIIIKRFYTVRIALIASTLLAFSPWSIIYSRKIWPQDFILPVVTLIFYSLHKIIIDKNNKYWAVLSASSLFLIQLHQSGLFFAPLIFLFLFLKRSKLSLKFLFVGLIIGILPFLPYVSYEISAKCPDCSTFLSAREKTGRSTLTFFRPFQIMGQGDFRFLLFSDTTEFANEFPFAYKLKSIFYIEYFLLPIGLFLFWLKNKNYRNLVYVTILLPILYFLAGVVPHMHYSIILTPFLFLFVSFAISYFLSSKKKIIKFTIALILLVLVLNSVLFDFSFFQFLKEKKALKGDYGSSFIITSQKSKTLLKGYENDPHYSEMMLASFVPKDSIYGNGPIGKMLYPHEKTLKNLANLETRLKEVPVDDRIKIELIAFYTYTNPTLGTIETLKEKSKTMPGYADVLIEVQRLYAENNKK